MAQPTKRRAHGEDAIYWDESKGRWYGSVSLGFDSGGKRLRRKVSGKTKTEVKDKLRELHSDMDAGVRTSASYTVDQAVADWMREGRDGRSARTLRRDELILRPVLASIGGIPLHALRTHDVRRVLSELAASRSSATVALMHNCLVRAIRHAESGDRVRRNVAALVKPPPGKGGGRPSRAMTDDQAAALLHAATQDGYLGAYVILSLTTGIRTEEARALRWDHVDLDGDPGAGVPPHIAVWRSARAGSDTKTERSRRTLGLPRSAVATLREQRKRQAAAQLAAGELWQDHGLVFASSTGRPLDVANVGRGFRALCEKAGVGESWSPRELRHTFVSLMSESGMAVEEIARLAGHSSSRTTEVVYRHELRPVITTGADAMDRMLDRMMSRPG
jgi:integrase